jgi:hypothetical protein
VPAVHHNTHLIANLVSEFLVGLPVKHFFTYLRPSEEIHQVLLCILHLCVLQLSFGSNVLFGYYDCECALIYDVDKLLL